MKYTFMEVFFKKNEKKHLFFNINVIILVLDVNSAQRIPGVSLKGYHLNLP